MDDIRRPHQPQRRDYALPSRPPAPRAQHPHHVHQPQAHPAPAQHHHPAYHPPTPAAAQPYQPAVPAYSPAPPPPVPQTYVPNPPRHPISHPHTAAHPVPRRRLPKLAGKRLSLIAGAVLAGGAIFGAGWLLKGSSSANGIPDNITRQVNYSLYFPSPMPSGYIYMKDTATFQIGQVFYKFADGRKRVTVNEQPLPQTPPNLNQLTNYTQFDSPAGKAAVGINLGEPSAIVITPTTVITMNSVGGVTQNDLRSAIQNFKNIGLRNQKT